MMYMPIIDIQTTRGAELFRQYMEAGEVPLAYEVCFSKLDDVAKDCCKRVVESGSKLWRSKAGIPTASTESCSTSEHR